MLATTTDFERFTTWAQTNNAYIHPNLRFSPKTASVLTTAPIPKGDQLLKCPHDLTIDHAKACAAFPSDRKDEIPPHALLCFFLSSEYEKGEDSFWWPYLNVLPQTFDTPLYFDDEDKRFLDGCNLGEADIEGRRDAWRKEYDEGMKVLGDAGKNLSWERFLWARTIFTSRSFPGSLMRWVQGTEIQSNKESFPVLFPVVDSLNHRPLTKITWAPSSDSMALITDADLPANVECFNNYGAKGNEELLMGYGFCLPNNPTDTVTLRFSPPLTPPQQSVRDHQPQPISPGIFYLRPSPPSPLFPHSLTSLFRLLSASPVELPYLQSNPATPKVSPRNEIAAYTHLFLAMQRKLHGLAAELPEPQNSKQRAAQIYRDGQIAILRASSQEALDAIAATIEAARTVTFPDVLADEKFKTAVEACFETSAQEELEEADQEDVIFVLFLCWKYLQSEDPEWRAWFEACEKAYGKPGEKELEEEEGVRDVFDAVFPDAAEVAEEVFGGEGWGVKLLGWSMMLFREEGVNTVLADGDAWFGVCLDPVGKAATSDA